MHRLFSSRIARRLRDTSGNSIVEAAIITPLLVLLTFGIIDFSSLFYVYLSLENGVSQATRYAITGRSMDDGGGSPLDRAGTLKAAMRKATPTLTIKDSDFEFSHMSVGGTTWTSGVGGPGEVEKLTVNYKWKLMTPMMRPFFTNGEINFKVESAMKNETYVP